MLKQLIGRKTALLLFLLAIFLTCARLVHKTHAFEFPEIRQFRAMPVNKSNLVTIEGVALGRYLFYDPILSKDSAVSCGTCHVQRNGFAGNVKQVYRTITAKKAKAKRAIIPLENLAWKQTFFWDGRVKTVEEQVFHPVRNPDEMNLSWTEVEVRVARSAFYRPMFRRAFGKGKIDSVKIANAIAQFERTLICYQSKFDQVQIGKAVFTEQEEEGYRLFTDTSHGNCITCHTLDLRYRELESEFANNGLSADVGYMALYDKGRYVQTSNEWDVGRFKIPSLRNVILTAPYMHDDRMKTLEEVLAMYGRDKVINASYDSRMRFGKNGQRYTENEIKCLLAFLRSLTDTSFITKKALSNPW